MTDAEEHELRERIKDLIDQRRMTDEELTRERVLGEFFISVVVHSDDQITIEKPDFDIGAMADEIVCLRERLAAATRVTDEMVERAAEALYLRGDLSHWGTWEQEIWRYKETYYEDARAILAAALETQEGA